MKPSRNWLRPRPGRDKAGFLLFPFRGLFQQPAVELGVMTVQVAAGKHLDHLIVADEGVAQAAQNIVVGHVDSWQTARFYHLRASQSEKRLIQSGPGSEGLPPHPAPGHLAAPAARVPGLADGHPVAQLLLELGEQALQARHPGSRQQPPLGDGPGPTSSSSTPPVSALVSMGSHLVEAGQQHGPASLFSMPLCPPPAAHRRAQSIC